jgi:Glycosyltransferase
LEVILLHQTFSDGDAIGHDIQGMYNVLEKLSLPVYIFCEYNVARSNYRMIDISELRKKIKHHTNLLIYHHSIYWQLGEQILKEAKCKVVVRYHNITPPEFFEKYSTKYYQTTYDGRRQTERFVKRPNIYWLSDSNYNNTELLELGLPKERSTVVPPFHKVEEINRIQADLQLLDSLQNSNQANVLFVGRVASNKGHMRICKVAKSYLELYGPQVTFWIVGGFDNEIQKYYEELNSYIKMWNLERNVIFTNKVPEGQLKTYYQGCDVFLCLSEHEGFCVPLIESQYLNLPVVACNTTAIAETLGDEQLVYPDFNDDLIAAAIHEVAKNRDIADYLIERGRQNYYNRFTNEIIEKKFVEYMEFIQNQ